MTAKGPALEVSEGVAGRLRYGEIVYNKDDFQRLLMEGYEDYAKKIFRVIPGHFVPLRDALMDVYEKEGVEGLHAFAEKVYGNRLPDPTLLGTSFEGIINDGAVECFFSMALGAYAAGLLPNEGPLGEVAKWVREKGGIVSNLASTYDRKSEEDKAKVKEMAKTVGERVKSFIISAQRITNSLSGEVKLSEREAKVRDVLLAFLALRPEVGVADDYMFVLRALQRVGAEKVKEVAKAYEAFRKGDSSAYNERLMAPLRKAYEEEKGRYEKGRDEAAFNAFYFARELMKSSSKEMWEQLNKPAPLFWTLVKFSQIRVRDIPLVSLSILSTKDEESIRQLCAAHVAKAAKEGVITAVKLGEEALKEKVGSEECFIRNINGLNSIQSKGAILGMGAKDAKGYKNLLQVFEKMKVEVGEETVEVLRLLPIGRWLRLDDRFEEGLVESLALLNVPTIVGEGGYAYPWSYREAMANTFVLDVAKGEELLVDAVAYNLLINALQAYWGEGDSTMWERLQSL